jgi:hypothetical protein
MLYKVTNSSLFKDNPELSTIKEFASIPDKILKWVFLVYDYEGPYRKLPLKERREFAAKKHLFTESGRTKMDKYVKEMLETGIPEVNHAIATFKEIQYDEDRETLNALDEAIRDLRSVLRRPAENFKDAKAKADLAPKMRMMAEERKKLAEIFEFRDELQDDEDDLTRSASLLDDYLETEDE